MIIEIRKKNGFKQQEIEKSIKKVEEKERMKAISTLSQERERETI